MARHRRAPHRPLAVNSSHWRADGIAKVGYPSEAAAAAAAADRSREAGVVLGVYRCDYCSSWHMGRRDERT
jgi:hypothetical protein